jgi:hypothetical protein
MEHEIASRYGYRLRDIRRMLEYDLLVHYNMCVTARQKEMEFQLQVSGVPAKGKGGHREARELPPDVSSVPGKTQRRNDGFPSPTSESSQG